ncbi:MAG: hypothetical protein M1818_000358 [Claussenomyces sp. TS43310]|nr:MAG: hypothetical protein M1818_000358 [Claussenomyces sp. TS43310]
MNIFGNAKKYTSAGFIQVRLRIEDDRKKKSESPKAEESSHRMLAMSIIDTGCGISREYMDRKLYTPFAQEDSFAPGVGLGLSIVYSIIIQLGGTISIRSDVGRGTDVEILVPVQDASSSDESLATLPDPHDTTSSDSEQCLGAARKIASGKTIALFRRKTIGRGEPNVFLTWKHVEEYCSSWLGFKIITTQDQTSASSADLVILEKKEKDSADLEHTFSTRVLILRQGIPSAKERDSQQAHGHMANIWNPIGPFKLARIMVALFQEAALSPESRTPLFRSLSDGVGQGAGLPSSLYSRTSSKVNLEDLVTGAAKPLRGDLKVTSDSAFVVAEPDVPGGPSRKPTADKIDQLAQNTQSLSIQVPSQTLSTQPDLTPLRLLAIDDNKLNLDLLCRYLSKRKVDTITRAVNGIEAVNTVKDSSECFDVIFMDISMPEMDGFEATRAIRRYERSARQELAHRPDATTNGRPKHLFGRSYIVALTGLASRRDRDAAIDSGLDEFWTKPFNFGKIGELLRRVSREKEKKWRLDNGPG